MSNHYDGIDRRVFLKFGAAFLASAAPGVSAQKNNGQSALLAHDSSSEKSKKVAARIQEFDFTTKAFAGSPDGREKELWGYNGQFPGPEIRVKQGDLIRVKVNNQLPAPTSIHWHGMKQRNTWDMDGVTPISRPAIKPGESFVYEFRAEPAGTH